MFTGIVQDTARIVQITEKQNFRTHVVQLNDSLRGNLSIGASVAHNGCCLTVSQIQDDLVSFDLMQETLNVTNLGKLKVGDRVNIERAAKFGDEIGGHSMSGHIMAITMVSQIIKTSNNCQMWFQIPVNLAKYIFTKGYIGIDGASLTIGDVKDGQFNVNLIPETLNRTNLKWRKLEDCINLEIDPQTQAIVDTIERIMADRI